MSAPAPVFVALTGTGETLARRLCEALPGAEVHGLAHRTENPDRAFSDTLAHVRALFTEGRPIIGICAVGILVRAVAPLLADKRSEPALIAVAEDGSAVVPVLGGHRGANRLARDIAATLGVDAGVTTAGDIGLGFALDDPPEGWRIEDPAPAKAIMAAMLGGDAVNVERAPHIPKADWLKVPNVDSSADVTIRLTDSAVDADASMLVMHPQILAVGVGCERNCAPDELSALVADTLADAGLAAGAVACVVSLDLKSDEPAVLALADHLNVPARFFDAAALEAETPRLEPFRRGLRRGRLPRGIRRRGTGRRRQ